MSKVICDVCGTTYPETAATCPICGCAKNSAEQTAAESSDTGSASYNYVKGGRFSKSNVRKRNRGKVAPQSGPQDGSNPNKGLVVVVLLLLLAIVAVLCYIGFKFLFPVEENSNPSSSSSSSSVQQGQQGGNVNDPGRIPCTGLILPIHDITLQNKDTVFHLSVEKQPANSTDTVTFTSSNPSVATVDANGKIYPVGGGEAVITVTCGEVTEQCTVKCTFAETPGSNEGEGEGEGGEEENPAPEVPEGFVLKLKGTFEKNGFTMSEKYPDPVSIYKEIDGVKATDITWTSDNEAVAKIDENGVVSAVGKGNTVVRGTIGDQTVSCTVIVAFTPAQQTEAKYTISHSDVTLNIGKDDSFRLSLKDEHGANVQNVVWTANEEGYVEIDGRNIKGIKATSDLLNKYVVVSTTIDDVTYSCKIYIHEAQTEE